MVLHTYLLPAPRRLRQEDCSKIWAGSGNLWSYQLSLFLFLPLFSTYTHTNIQTHTHAYKHIHTDSHMHASTHTHTQTFKHTQTHTCIQAHTHTETNTHIQKDHAHGSHGSQKTLPVKCPLPGSDTEGETCRLEVTTPQKYIFQSKFHFCLLQLW